MSGRSTASQVWRWVFTAVGVVALVAGALAVSGVTAGSALGTDHDHAEREAIVAMESFDPDTPVFAWAATSPTTHEGDTYRLSLTNGAEPTRIWVYTIIMDHMNQTNPVVINQPVDLDAGEQLVLTAANDYGLANHFKTHVVSLSPDLTFEVTLTDASGEPTAWFNERAFHLHEGTLRDFLKKRLMMDRSMDEGHRDDHRHMDDES